MPRQNISDYKKLIKDFPLQAPVASDCQLSAVAVATAQSILRRLTVTDKHLETIETFSSLVRKVACLGQLPIAVTDIHTFDCKRFM